MSARFELQNFLPRHIRKMLHVKKKSETQNRKGAYNVLDLDKNESAWGTIGTDTDYSRYPDPDASILKKELSEQLNISTEKIIFGNGSDELLDLVMRIFTQQGKDHMLAFSPYDNRVSHFAALNGLILDEMPLNSEFQFSIFQAKHHYSKETKILYMSNPNSISGVALRSLDIIDVIDDFNGIVIVDESNIAYNDDISLLDYLDSYPNLIIIRSFSNVWGMAGLRLGALFASPKIIEVINAVKAPFNVNSVAQEIALKALRISEHKERIVRDTISERERLSNQLLEFRFVKEVYKSETNFILVKVDKPSQFINYLEDERIYVYDASEMPGCDACIRITIGNEEQNQRLIKTLREMSSKTAPARVLIRKIGQTLQKASVFLGFFKKIIG